MESNEKQFTALKRGKVVFTGDKDQVILFIRMEEMMLPFDPFVRHISPFTMGLANEA